MRRLKITRMVVLLLVCIFIMSLTVFQGNVVSGQNQFKAEITVISGDTLWSLAREHAPRGMDIREYVDLMLNENNLESPIVYPGQVIQLP
jgi:K+-transporting ATPase A subunit